MPFRSIDVTTLITPNLDVPNDLSYPCFFWAKVLGQRFLFHFVGRDATGRTTDFTAPIIFFNYNQRRNLASIQAVEAAYRTSGEWRRDFAGQTVAFAPSQTKGDTDLESAFVYFSAYPDPHPPAVPAPAAVAAAPLAAAAPMPQVDDGICCAQQRKRV